MARVLITSGPTRQYLDPVRFLTNASSGRMGLALAQATLEAGHHAIVVSGPVEVSYPTDAEVLKVVSTEEMLLACQQIFPRCDGLIGVAAPCDYRPQRVATDKIQKTGEPLRLLLQETPDIVATLAATRTPVQWVVGFALETTDLRLKALAKLQRKSCDLMVVNGIEAMNATDTTVEILDPQGTVIAHLSGDKREVARGIFAAIQERLIESAR